MDLREFSYEINKIKKSERYQEALDYFKIHKSNFTIKQIASNSFIIADIIASLRKTNKSEFVELFLKTYGISINKTTPPNILIQYGWSVYDVLKNLIDQNKYDKNKIINLLRHPLVVLSNSEANNTTSILSNIIRIVLKKEKERQNQDHNFLNQFLDLINPNALDRNEQTFEKNGKTIRSASDFETWYAGKSKHLFELKKYQECFDISQEAIQHIDNYHSNNDLWFARRMALSKQAMGNTKEAIEDLKKVFRRKQDWFIQKEIAQLYFDMNDLKNAYKNAMEAIKLNGFSKIEFKIGLIFLLGKILRMQNNLELANEHFLLIKLIREQHKWSIPQELSVEMDTTQKFNNMNYDELFSKLKNFWQPNNNEKNQDRSELKNGTIRKILNDNERGKDGFLEFGGESFYFTIPVNINFVNNIQEGIGVGFIDITNGATKKRAKIVKILR